MTNYMLKFKPFANAFEDEMKIEAESLLKAADEFKKVFPKGRIIEIQPEFITKLNSVIYYNFQPQRSRKVLGDLDGQVIYVDFKKKS